MSKVLFIGNNFSNQPVHDGQHGKTRLYLEIFKREGIDVDFVELDRWKRHPLSLLIKVKRGIKRNDIILLQAAYAGSRLLIPLINKWNKRFKRKFIYSLIGTGVINQKKVSDPYVFFRQNSFNGYSDKRIARNLKKVDYILPETNILVSTYQKLFGLNNCYLLTNFRDIDYQYKEKDVLNKDPIRFVYMARVTKKKGIFTLLESFKELGGLTSTLDIYGMLQLNQDEKNTFFNSVNSLKNVSYKGELPISEAIRMVSSYDVLVFPSSYCFEGFPGTVVESLIVGTPLISSRFVQSSEMLNDGVDSLLFNVGDVDGLKKAIETVVNDRNLLLSMSKNAFENGKRFTYKYNRSFFLKLFNCENSRNK